MKEFNYICDNCKKTDMLLWNIILNFKGRGNNMSKELCKECASKSFDVDIDKLKFLETLITFKLKNSLNNWEKWTDLQVATFVDLLEQNKIPLDIRVEIYHNHRDSPIYLSDLIKGIAPMKDVEEEIIDEKRKKKIQEILRNRLKKGSVKIGKSYLPKDKVDKALEELGVNK